MPYCALLYAPDGNFVMDYEYDTIEEVRKKLENRTSQWYFFPFEFIVDAEKHVIVEDPYGGYFVGKTIDEVTEMFEKAYKDIEDEKIDILPSEYIDYIIDNFIKKEAA